MVHPCKLALVQSCAGHLAVRGARLPRGQADNPPWGQGFRSWVLAEGLGWDWLRSDLALPWHVSAGASVAPSFVTD